MPSNVASAPRTEAHFIVFVLELMRSMPRIITDCKTLVDSARDKPWAELVQDRVPLAGLWMRIIHATGDVNAWARSGNLVWMPAHTKLQDIGEFRLSDGSRLTAKDWRANRLVDVLAKQEAKRTAASKATTKLLESAATAV